MSVLLVIFLGAAQQVITASPAHAISVRQPYSYFAAGLCTSDFEPGAPAAPESSPQ
ncbi:MAG TPA: hypothetical protein VF702_05075 [Allosphingosinicella sp.]|jgi:hypothetical protein